MENEDAVFSRTLCSRGRCVLAFHSEGCSICSKREVSLSSRLESFIQKTVLFLPSEIFFEFSVREKKKRTRTELVRLGYYGILGLLLSKTK